MRRLECFIGQDILGRHYVAGKTGSGKSLILRGIAASKGLPYIGEEYLKHFNFPMTCETFLKINNDVAGMVIDLPRVEMFLSDFKEYKWNIPIYYSIQLNRAGNIKPQDIDYYKIYDLETI